MGVCPNPSCGDLVFASKIYCSLCGTPRSGEKVEGGGWGGAKSKGDWICPNPSCGDSVWASKTNCSMCGTPKPSGRRGGWAAPKGDWVCPNPSCGDLVWASKLICSMCGTPKPPAEQQGGCAAPKMMQGDWAPRPSAELGGCAGPQMMKGDWVCPNPSCGDLVFASKATCYLCGTPRPSEECSAPLATAIMEAGNPTHDEKVEGGGWVGQKIMKGDWVCPNPMCGDLVFASKANCYLCGTPRPSEERSGPYTMML